MEHGNIWEPGHTIIIRPTRFISFATQIEQDRERITHGIDRMAQREIEGLVRNERPNVARQGKGN